MGSPFEGLDSLNLEARGRRVLSRSGPRRGGRASVGGGAPDGCVIKGAGLLLVMLSAGCASLPVTPVEHALFRDLGEVEGERLERAVEEVLVEDRGFTLSRRSRGFASLYYETRWRGREPFQSETDRGVVAARSRVILRGRRTSGGAYRAMLEAENEVRTDSLPSWHSTPVGPSFREWMDAVAEELRSRLDSG